MNNRQDKTGHNCLLAYYLSARKYIVVTYSDITTIIIVETAAKDFKLKRHFVGFMPKVLMIMGVLLCLFVCY